MSILLVVAGYALVLLILSVGVGLLVERLAGWRIPAPLVPVFGFAGLVVVSQYTVLPAFLAPYTPWVLAVLAISGFVAGRSSVVRRWRNRSFTAVLPFLAAGTAYATLTAPVWASFRFTFPGYLLDTTNGFHLAGAEWILHHGEHFTDHSHAYGAMLINYFQAGHPTGGNVLLGATGWLTGQDLVWLLQPYQSFAVSLVALAVYYLARRASLTPLMAAFTGLIAAVPALVYSYTLMGSIKELSTLPAIFGIGALIPLAREQVKPGVRGVIPLAVAAGAGIGTLGPSFGPWLVALGGANLLFAIPAIRESLRGHRLLAAADGSSVRITGVAAGLGIAAIAAGAVLAALPTAANFRNSLNMAESLSGSNAPLANDHGNLERALRFVQAFGVWLGLDHRTDPKYLFQTYLLIGIVIAATVIGAIWLIRRRAWPLVAFAALEFAVYGALVIRGTEWTDAKILMMLSPAVLFLAMTGAYSVLSVRRAEGILLAAVIGLAVFASDALAYHGTNPAPGERFKALAQIEDRFSGQGPTLLTDFDEYAFYMLRHMSVDSPSYAGAMRRNFVMADNTPELYAHSYDIDDIAEPSVQEFNLIVQRRSPRWSRPPGNFRLVYQDQFYDVWRKHGLAPLMHIPLGSGLQQPVGKASCKTVSSLARQARNAHVPLRYAHRQPNVVADLSKAFLSDAFLTVDLEGLPQIDTSGPATIIVSVHVPAAGRYRLWIGGEVGRAVELRVDSRPVGTVSYQTGGDGNMINVARVDLAAGRHTIELIQGGGNLQPGSGQLATIDGVYLEPISGRSEAVTTISPARWRSLCDNPDLDWIEIPGKHT